MSFQPAIPRFGTFFFESRFEDARQLGDGGWGPFLPGTTLQQFGQNRKTVREAYVIILVGAVFSSHRPLLTRKGRQASREISIRNE